MIDLLESTSWQRFYFPDSPREIKDEIFQLSGKRIPSYYLMWYSSASLSRGVVPLVLPLMLNEELLGMHSQGSDLMLPIRILLSTCILGVPLTYPLSCVSFGRNSKRVSANCLLDSGIEQTYLSSEVLKPFGNLESVELDLKIQFVYTPWRLWQTLQRDSTGNRRRV